MDEIVNRVVDELADAGLGADADESDSDEIEVHGEEEDADDEGHVDDDAYDEAHERGRDAREAAQERRREATEEAQERRQEAHRRREEARRRARQAREAADGLEDLGDRIEAAVEGQLDHLGEHIERSFSAGLGGLPEPTTPGVVIGPDDTREKAVYKTQLQKGGRVAVPDTEIEALGLEPGDTLQVVLYPVD